MQSQHTARLCTVGVQCSRQAHGKPQLEAQLHVGPGISLGTDVANTGANELSAVAVCLS